MVAKGKTDNDRKPADNRGTVSFLNYTLSKSEKSDLRKWRADHDGDFWTMCGDLLSSGVGISVSLDGRNQCVACYLRGSGLGGTDANTLLVGRGSSFESAVWGALFRHYVVFDGQWGADHGPDRDLDDFE